MQDAGNEALPSQPQAREYIGRLTTGAEPGGHTASCRRGITETLGKLHTDWPDLFPSPLHIRMG